MNKWDFIINCDDGSVINVSPNSALVFLDETGDEQLKDPKYPIFGLGGCCILAKNYFILIDRPWSKMKLKMFNLKNKPLHAAGNSFSYKQITAINNFFLSNEFGRFTTISSLNTQIDTILKMEQVVFYSFCKRVLEIIKWYEFENIIVIYDNSERLKPKLQEYASTIDFAEKLNGVDTKIETHYCVVNKETALSGVEVADFIIHSAGTSLRDLINGKIYRLTDREDFNHVFNTTDKKISSFFQVNSAAFTSK